MHFRQAMNHAVAIGAKHRVSALRRQESKKAKDGLPAAMFVNSDPIPGLVRRIEGKSKEAVVEEGFPGNEFAYCGLDTGTIGSSFDVDLGSKTRCQEVESESVSDTATISPSISTT
jgi:hypothetical protein